LVVAYCAGLLHYGAAADEDYEIGDAANVVALGELRIFFGVDFYHYRSTSHVGSGARNFESRDAAWAAPIGPEIHENGNRRVLNNFIELRIIDGERLRDGRQG
jgi:hypothetical protein